MNEKDEILAGYLIKDNHEAFTEGYSVNVSKK